MFVGVSLFMTFLPPPAVRHAAFNALALGPRRPMLSAHGNAAGIFIAKMASLNVL